MILAAAVELGGTRASVTAGYGPGECADPVTIQTTTPEETLAAVADALSDLRGSVGRFERIGVASFGPVGVDPMRPNWGHIGPTPKPHWSGANVAGALARRLGAPVVIDTDVNGAALGEGRWGASQGCGSHAYVTVGTGVGVGIVIDGRPVHGLAHPEAGHLKVRRAPSDDFPGRCPWHQDCLEGLICGPALHDRLGAPAEELEDDDPVFDLVGRYLGQALASVALIAQPERIVVGGGVGRRPGVLAGARAAFSETLNGYVAELADRENEVIVPQALGGLSGLYGALVLAQEQGGLQSFA